MDPVDHYLLYFSCRRGYLLARLCLRPSAGNSLFKLLKDIILQHIVVSTYNLSLNNTSSYVRLLYIMRLNIWIMNPLQKKHQHTKKYNHYII